jgi:uncharacterized protein YqjF (DUF2071 family)
MDVLRMRWTDALFAHWPVDPSVVSARLPAGLEAATYDGRAWLGVVGFAMEDIRPRGSPVGLSFPELNLRTYVRRPGSDDHAVYFFSLDADDRVGVALARRLFRLPYFRAEIRVTRESGGTIDDDAGTRDDDAGIRDGDATTHDGDDGAGTHEDDAVTLRHRRTHADAPPARFAGTYRPLEDPSPPAPETLEHFLTENYRFYTEGDRLYYGDIDHPPWPLAAAEVDIESNTLFAANGFERPAGDPVVHYAPGTEVTAGRLHAVR